MTGEFQNAPTPDPSQIVGYRIEQGVLIFDKHFTTYELQTLSGYFFSDSPLTSCNCEACELSRQEDVESNDSNNNEEGKINAKLVTINRLSLHTNLNLMNVLSEIAYADVNDPRFITSEVEQGIVNFNDCWCICTSNRDG